MKKLITIIFTLIALASRTVAQDFIDDAGIWVSIGAEKKLSRYWSVRLKNQTRINENISELGRSAFDLGMTFSLNKNLSFSGGYVLAERKRIDDTYSTRHQGYLTVVLKLETGRWRFAYRNMLQARVKDIYSSEDGRIPTWYERNKLTIKYELTKRFTLFTAGELYYPLDQRLNKGFDRSRTFWGMSYKLGRHTELEAYFLYQRELNAFGPTNRDYINGIGLEHRF